MKVIRPILIGVAACWFSLIPLGVTSSPVNAIRCQELIDGEHCDVDYISCPSSCQVVCGGQEVKPIWIYTGCQFDDFGDLCNCGPTTGPCANEYDCVEDTTTGCPPGKRTCKKDNNSANPIGEVSTFTGMVGGCGV